MAFRQSGEVVVTGEPAAADMGRLPALEWPDRWIEAHGHHHHRFDRAPEGPGAEVEASRGCPYACAFCAKLDFRDAYRRRPLPTLLAEIDGLIGQGVRYLYFIDEIFLPWRELLAELGQRDVQFGVQTRIDLWKPEMLDRLGEAGCVSIEAGVESLTPEGRQALDKDCRLSTEELTERLIRARQDHPLRPGQSDRRRRGRRRGDRRLARRACRATASGPTIRCRSIRIRPRPTTGSAGASRTTRPGSGRTQAYLAEFDRFSDIQEARPLPLPELEAACACS